MTLEPAAFLERLPEALGLDPPIRADGFIHRSAGRSCTCRLSPLPPLRLGVLSLERLRVEFILEGYGAGEAEAFFERFLRGVLRGGG